MYTGIVDHYGTITKIDNFPEFRQLWIETHFENIELGESICLDGICVTVAAIEGQTFRCDLSPETLRMTNAKCLNQGMKVNLERSLLPTTRMGGHWVAGHIDQTCQVKSIFEVEGFKEIVFTGLDQHSRRYFIKKGSTAVNGVSLTINVVNADGFSVMLIPHTLERTNLSLLSVGDEVNIEYDMTARIIIEQCDHYLSALQVG